MDKGLARIEAIDKGKISEKEIEKFKLVLPMVLKAMDKLHPNKQDLTTNGESLSVKVLLIDKELASLYGIRTAPEPEDSSQEPLKIQSS